MHYLRIRGRNLPGTDGGETEKTYKVHEYHKRDWGIQFEMGKWHTGITWDNIDHWAARRANGDDEPGDPHE